MPPTVISLTSTVGCPTSFEAAWPPFPQKPGAKPRLLPIASILFNISGPFKDYDLSTRLGELSLPVLITCGRYDEVTPEGAAWCSSLISGSEMVVFEQSAHMAHFEEPELYLKVVQDFLSRVEGEFFN